MTIRGATPEAAAIQRELDAPRDKDRVAAAYEERFTASSVLLAGLAQRRDGIEATDDRAARRESIQTFLV